MIPRIKVWGVRVSPNLQEVEGLRRRCIVLAMIYSFTGASELDTSSRDPFYITHAVSVLYCA